MADRETQIPSSSFPVVPHYFFDGIEGDAVWLDAELANERADAADQRLDDEAMAE